MQNIEINESKQQGIKIAQKQQKQNALKNDQPQFFKKELQQKQQQQQQGQTITAQDKLQQLHNEALQAQQMNAQQQIQQGQPQLQQQQQLQLQQQQQQLNQPKQQDKDVDLKQKIQSNNNNPQNQDEEEDQEEEEERKKQFSQDFIADQELQLKEFLKSIKADKRRPSEQEYEWMMNVWLNVSSEYQNVGNIFLKQKKFKQAEKWFIGSLKYTEQKEIADEIISLQNDKAIKKDPYKMEWYLQRISITNSLHALYKRLHKTSRVIDLIKKVITECETCQFKNKIQEHVKSNIENLYYHLAEYMLIRVSSLNQAANQKTSQVILGGNNQITSQNNNQQSLTNLAQLQQTNLMQQKSELEDIIRYAKTCIQILQIKYHNISSKKDGDVFVLEDINTVYLEKKQIMFIHTMYLIGRALQWAEFYGESLSFYKQAYSLAYFHFKRKGVHPIEKKDDLLLQYRQKIKQVTSIIFQNEIDDIAASPEQFDKPFREDLDAIQIGNEDQKLSLNNSKTLSLNLDVVQPYLLTTEFDDALQDLAPTNANSKNKADYDNLILFTDESLAVSQILTQFGSGNDQRQPTEKSQKNNIRISTKNSQGKANAITNQNNMKNQQIGKNSDNYNNNLLQDLQKNNKQVQKKILNRRTSLNNLQKEGSLQGRNEQQNSQFKSNMNTNSQYHQKLSRQRTSKIGLFGYIDQENETAQQIVENRTQKRAQGQQTINQLADQMQLNYNNYLEFRKEISDQKPLNLQNDDLSIKSDYFQGLDKKNSISYHSQQQMDFKSNSNSYQQQIIQDPSSKKLGVKSNLYYQQGFTSPTHLNSFLHNQQQMIQNSFQQSSTKKLVHLRPLTSNTQLSTYRPSSSNRNQHTFTQQQNSNLKNLYYEDNVFDNIIEQSEDPAWTKQADLNNSQLSQNQNNGNMNSKQGQLIPNSPINNLFQYELLLRPSDSNKIIIRDTKKLTQGKKQIYQIKVSQHIKKNNYTRTNNSYQTIDEQGSEYQKQQERPSGMQTPQRQSSSFHIKNINSQDYNKLLPSQERQRQRPSTSNYASNHNNHNANYQNKLFFQDNNHLLRPNSNSNQNNNNQQQISQKKSNQYNSNNNNNLNKQQQQQNQQNFSDQKNQEDLNNQKQINTIQKYKQSNDIFDDERTFNFIQGFDLDKVINQRFDRLIAEVDERNIKDRENSLQKLEYIGSDNRNLPQNQPTIQNEDDLSSDDEREGLQEEKQQQDNQNKDNANNQTNLQMNLESNLEKAQAQENDKISKEKEEYIQYKNRESKKIEEVYQFFKKVKPCRDRFLVFYQKFNKSVTSLWKLEKFNIKFSVSDPNKDVASLANFNFKNKESIYKFTLSLNIESMFYTGKLLFTIQKTDLQFLQNFLYYKNIITRWGIADFILSEYFLLPQNQSLMNDWNSFYNLMEGGQSQILISFDQSIGKYQGSFQIQENIELMNIGIKLQFLIGYSLKLVRTPTGEKLKLIHQTSSPMRSTLNKIPLESTTKQLEEQDDTQQELYQKNYLYLKEFLKVRRQIVRKTIINLEKMSPQIYIKFGVHKKVKQVYLNSPSSSPSNRNGMFNENYDEDIAKQYQIIKDYVNEYRDLYFQNLISYERAVYQNEEVINKNQPSNSPHIQKQFEFLSSRARQKSSIPNIAQIGGGIKNAHSLKNIMNQMQLTPLAQNTINMQSSFNPQQNIPPNNRVSYQQNSPNSNTSLNDPKNIKQNQSRNNSLAQLSEFQVNKYSADMENQGEMEQPNEQINSSMDSSQSKLSIMRTNQGNGSSSNSQIKEDSRGMIRHDSIRNREGSKQENKYNNNEDDQTNNLTQQQNPTIERFFLRNINKKSTFSMIKQNDKGKDSSEEQNSINQDEIEHEDMQYFDENRNESVNLLPQQFQKDYDDYGFKGKTQKQIMNEADNFALSYNNPDELEDKTSSFKDTNSIERNMNEDNNDPKNQIKLFKQEINLSVGSKSSDQDSKNEEKYENDMEENSELDLNRVKRARLQLHSQSSVESSEQYVDMYQNMMPDHINQNPGSQDQRLAMKQIFNYDDKMVQSEQMFSPRSFTDENGQGDNNYNKQLTQMQYLQQQIQDNSAEQYQQSDYLKNKSDEQNELEYDDNRMYLQDVFQSNELLTIRQKEDSKNLQVNSEGMVSLAQNDYSSSQMLKFTNQQGNNPTNIEEMIKQKIEAFRQILLRQDRIKFSTPQEYISYFEENQNIAQIAVPNIFINAFRQRDLLLSGIMKLGSMSIGEYTRIIEGNKNIQGGTGTNKGKYDDQNDEDEEAGDFGHLFQKYQKQQEQIIVDNNERFYFFVTFYLSYTQNAEVEWNVEKIKNDVQIHVEAIQLISEYSQHSLSRYSSQFSLYEFISNLFPEDNDLATQEYYDTIQQILKKAQGGADSTTDNNDSEGQKQQNNNNNNINENEESILREENFGLNVETLQNEALYPFTDFNIRFQKSVCNHHFKLNKFIYNIGFTSSQKKVILDRLNRQMVIVNEQLRLIPRRIKRFRLLSDTLYFVDDNKYQSLVTQHIAKQNAVNQKQKTVQINKLGMNTFNNVYSNQNSLVNSIQVIKSQITFQNKSKVSRNDQEDINNSEENQNSDSQTQQTDKNKTPALTNDKQTLQNIKIQPGNSIELDDQDIQNKIQQNIELIQNIISAEKLYHLYLIITRQSPDADDYKTVLTQQQFEEKQSAQSQDVLDSTNDNKSSNKISNFTYNIEPQRDSILEKSQIKSPQSVLFQQSISQDISLQQKKQRKSSILTSINAQKLTKKLKKAIKSEFNNIRTISKEERERNYNNGKINHPYAMLYYNSVLRIDSDRQNMKNLKEMQLRRKRGGGNDIRMMDNRDTFRREEDVRIIESILSHKDGFKKNIKVKYLIDSNGELNSNISFYDPLSYRLEKVRVKERKNLEKLQNLLQVSNSLLRNNKLRDILLKMNMKWSKKIIGRKLEFRSFIETNEDFFNYKLNRKKNPNDEALYKLMTTKHFLDENIQQYTNFLYKVKLALISNDQNADTAEQNYFFNTYFYSTRVQQFQKINNLGRALIQTTVYQSKLLYTTDNYVFIRIDITPATKRTKLIKMILDYNDIITIFQKTQYSLKNCLDPEAITKMIIEFAEKVNYSHTQNYNALKIPFWKQFNQISESSDYDLVNQFDFNSMNTKQEISFLSKKSMLTPVLRTLKIIYQGIKKINNQFLVITVKRYIYLNIDWFQLIIYIPKTSRRFICYMMESDMLKFDPEFMEQVIPLVIVKYESNINELKQSKNYFQFCESFDQMHKRLVQQEGNDPFRRTEKKITFRSENWFRKSSEEITSHQSLKINKNKTSVLLQNKGDLAFNDYRSKGNNGSLQSIESLNDFRESSLNSSHFKLGNQSKYASQKTNFVKYFQKNLTEQTSFLEKKVWEHLISAIVVEENLQHKLVLKINTFNGILRETLSSMVLNMNERDNILYEFYIEEQKKKTLHSIFLESRSIKLEESFYQNFYIRIHFFGQELVHNQKVCGRHMLYSYHKKARNKLKNKTIENDNMSKQNSGSQVRISLSQTRISEQKIPSLTKIPQKIAEKQVRYKRTSITEKKGQLTMNPQGQLSKKSFENLSRQSLANTQKSIAEQVGAAADNPFLYSFILADLQEMAIFYANKIKANYNQFVKEREKKQLKGNIQNYLSLYKRKSLFKDSECEAIIQPNKQFKRLRDIEQKQKNFDSQPQINDSYILQTRQGNILYVQLEQYQFERSYYQKEAFRCREIYSSCDSFSAYQIIQRIR